MNGITSESRETKNQLLALRLLMLLALALRLAAAQGDLWLDEAWSAHLANAVTGPMGVFIGINQDNNHHLNSLWLNAIGPDAPTWIARSLSISCGVLAVPLAWTMAGRSGPTAALIGGTLFAVSPTLVNYGSEARGYAGMILAFLAAIALIDRSQAPIGRPHSALLALVALLGMLSHLTMLFGLVGLTLWAALEFERTCGPLAAITRTVRLFGPTWLTALLVVFFVFKVAPAGTGGFELGGYHPFELKAALSALGELVGYSIGLGKVGAWAFLLLIMLLPLALRLMPKRDSRRSLNLLILVTFPLTVLLLEVPNAGFPRYYLICTVALLLLVAEVLGRVLDAGGRARKIASTVLTILVSGSLLLDLRIASDRRADPGEALRAMELRRPTGATVLLPGQERVQVRVRPAPGEDIILVDIGRDGPVLLGAANQAGYPLQLVLDRCTEADFLFFSAPGNGSEVVKECGRLYRRIVFPRVDPMLSGLSWFLYEREQPSVTD